VENHPNLPAPEAEQMQNTPETGAGPLGLAPPSTEQPRPQQESAEGKQGLQGPITVDRSEQLQPSQDRWLDIWHARLPTASSYETPQPESQTEPPQAKRTRGRPRLPEEERKRRQAERASRYYQEHREKKLNYLQRWQKDNKGHLRRYRQERKRKQAERTIDSITSSARNNVQQD
jgi:hypothetical protein